MFKQRDADGDGKLTAEELPEPMREQLGQYDTDGDGALSQQEVTAGIARRGPAVPATEQEGSTPEGNN
jgi:hypothetical protein